MVDEEALVYPENFGPRMSMDETSLHNGELWTVITNKDAKGGKGCLAALIKGTKNKVVSDALSKVPVSKLMGVKEITVDLANSMDWSCRTNFMNAVITADRFHVQGIVHEAVQEMRIVERRKAIDEENELMLQARKEGWKFEPARYENGDTKKQLLARGRYLLFKPAYKWSDSQRKRAAILFRAFPKLQQAYDLSMRFRAIFELSQSDAEAASRLSEWLVEARASQLETMVSASQTIHNNYGKILNFFRNRATNASAESFNAKLKGFRSLVRGVRDIRFFLFRVEKLYA